MLLDFNNGAPIGVPPISTDGLLDTTNAAARLGVTGQTLNDWRITGYQNIPFTIVDVPINGTISKQIRYRREDLENWLANRPARVIGAPDLPGESA
ncbi:helix-turn-helix domain-containing protein [Caballeronia sp. LZ035]|uniref:helix-turn-helix domain-containing protein n=1 Tax=Caballeronia sp. LZ035 TaxID=3038568 RepID=UPI0028660977|nr:helix-turn-helix domain-containing protein [Caballeronia sp. LZ035]MDR5758210.1 helix-turn-helix domain-containing protein [Caballeronia sp. LZ035]